MIDINNSQDYDPGSFDELVGEEKQKRATTGLGALSALTGYGAAGSGLLGQGNLLTGVGSAGALSRLVAADSVTDLAKADAAQEITDPVEFLKKEYPNQQVFRFILTHPDLDHMRGLKRLHETVGFVNFWDTAHTKPAPSAWKGTADQEDWKFYQALRGGQVAGPKVLNFTRGSSAFAFARDENGNLGGDNIEILSPTTELVSACNKSEKSNDLSLVLRVRHGTRSILLPGDAEAAAWKEMVAHYGRALKSDYLKASHHGRDSGYDLEALKLIDPRITFVSVGRKPDTDASSKYRKQCPKVASTRFYGNMELRFLDDGTVSWFVDRNADK
jgi:beta-lactamase superfamily II metal-dependent hydrolase